MQLVPKAMTDGPASSSYARRRSRVVAVRAVEVDTRQLPFTAIIHRNWYRECERLRRHEWREHEGREHQWQEHHWREF
jgi:hypothetical protein